MPITDVRPGQRAWRVRNYRPAEEGRTYEVLAVHGTPSVFEDLGIGPGPGRAICRVAIPPAGPRSARRGELYEIPLADLMLVPDGFTPAWGDDAAADDPDWRGSPAGGS